MKKSKLKVVVVLLSILLGSSVGVLYAVRESWPVELQVVNGFSLPLDVSFYRDSPRHTVPPNSQITVSLERGHFHARVYVNGDWLVTEDSLDLDSPGAVTVYNIAGAAPLCVPVEGEDYRCFLGERLVTLNDGHPGAPDGNELSWAVSVELALQNDMGPLAYRITEIAYRLDPDNPIVRSYAVRTGVID